MTESKQIDIMGQPVEAPAGWDKEFSLMGLRIREKTETKRSFKATYLGWKMTRPEGLEMKDGFDPEKETINRSRIGPKAATGIEPTVRERFQGLIEGPVEIEGDELQAGWEEKDVHTWRTPKAEIKVSEATLAKLTETWKADHRKAEGKAKAFIQRQMKVLKDEVMLGGDWDLHSEVLLANLMDHIKARLNQSAIDGGMILDKAAEELRKQGIDAWTVRV